MRALAFLAAGLLPVWSCARAAPPASSPPRPAPAASRPLPAASGVIFLMGIELPEAGSTIGGHYAGTAYDVRQSGYQITESVRARWQQDARVRGEAILRGQGFRVRAVGPSSSDAQQLRGVQYGLAGRVTELLIRSNGTAEPYRVEAQVTVSWEVLDLGAGTAVLGRSVHQVVREQGAVDAVVGRALDASLLRLLADSTFRYVLAAPRADPDAGVPLRFARTLPARGDTILLAREDLNPSGDSSALGRLSAGLAMLRNPDHVLGTAILLTRDGLALVAARAVRDMRRLRARLPNGIERPVRLLRLHRGLDIALIQVACIECETVDWEAPRTVDVYTQVLTIGAALDEAAPEAAYGRVGGRWGMANGVTLDVPDGSVDGGEPVARAASGRVFAVVSARPGRRAALLLSEVLAALKVRLELPRT